MHLTFITTAGTIFQRLDPGTGQMVIGASLTDIVSTVHLKSMGVTTHDWVDLGVRSGAELTYDSIFAARDAVRSRCRQPHPGAFVLVTGTDTLEEFAFCLDLLLSSQDLLPGRASLVVTGAMKPYDIEGYDGRANVQQAVQVAVSPLASRYGVLVCLNDSIHLARYVAKTDSQLMGAFASAEPGGPVGQVREGRVRFYYGPPPDDDEPCSSGGQDAVGARQPPNNSNHASTATTATTVGADSSNVVVATTTTATSHTLPTPSEPAAAVAATPGNSSKDTSTADDVAPTNNVHPPAATSPITTTTTTTSPTIKATIATTLEKTSIGLNLRHPSFATLDAAAVNTYSRVGIWTTGVSGFVPEALLREGPPEAGLCGLVVAAPGTGSLSAALTDQLAAHATQLPIVLVSRCGRGNNYDDHYYRGSLEKYERRGLLLAGFEHVTPVQARHLLVFRLAAGLYPHFSRRST